MYWRNFSFLFGNDCGNVYLYTKLKLDTMKRKRVDIEPTLHTLAWAASEATKLGISRRQFLTRLVEAISNDSRLSWRVEDVLNYEFRKDMFDIIEYGKERKV